MMWIVILRRIYESPIRLPTEAFVECRRLLGGIEAAFVEAQRNMAGFTKRT